MPELTKRQRLAQELLVQFQMSQLLAPRGQLALEVLGLLNAPQQPRALFQVLNRPIMTPRLSEEESKRLRELIFASRGLFAAPLAPPPRRLGTETFVFPRRRRPFVFNDAR